MKALFVSSSEPIGGTATLIEILRQRAENQPEQLAYTFLVDGETEEQTLTYGELDRQARAIAAWLQAHDCEGERVLLLYPTGLLHLAAFFGCLYAGAIAVSTHSPRLKHSQSRLQAIVANAEAKFLLSPSMVLSKIDSLTEHAPSIKSLQTLATDQLEITASLADSWKQPPAGRETLAFLQYTSGSTSTPKGVMVTHGNILHNSADINRGCEFTPQSVSLSWVPHFHDMGLIIGLMQPVVYGFHGILMPPAAFLQRPSRWLEAITRYRVTHSGGPNSAYDLCVRRVGPAQRESLDLSSWQVAYNGAEPIHPATLDRFVEAFASCGFRRETFTPAYGLAEATLDVAHVRKGEAPVLKSFDANALLRSRAHEVRASDSHARTLVGSGRADGETLVRIVNPETLVECSPEEIGEIWVSGPNVAKGYWNQPDETRRTFHARLAGTSGPHFLRTGDLGFLSDGELFVTGRFKDVIIINGRNHYPQDIEKTVEACHPLLREGCSAAFSVEAEDSEQLVVVVEVERRFRGQQDEANRIFASIRQAVAEQHDLAVRHISLLKTGKILKTTSGKIQRRACREGFLSNTLDTLAQWPPRSEVASHADAESGVIAKQRIDSTRESRAVVRKPAREIAAWLTDKLASQVHVEPREIDPEEPFTSFGLGSMQSTSLSGELSEWLDRALPATLLYDYPTIASLSKFLAGESLEHHAQASNNGSLPDALNKSLEPVAIIGIGCRFPGADNAEAFWNLLRQGVDAVTEYPSERRGASERFAGANEHRGGFLAGVDQFDAHFFSVAPREAPYLDPQQRLLLEVAWEALENTGQSPAKLAGSQTGVFIGISNSDYHLLQISDTEGRASYAPTGVSHSIAANRLSYFLDLHGPSIAVDTACSSSLVAVHLACQSIQRGESRMALAGGVNLILNPGLTNDLARAGMLSPDGRCKVFDAGADGYVRAEGCGIVVLKKFSDALRDRDNIIALIRASASNQDGRSNGLTAPNGRAQQAVIRRALETAGVSPAEISFVETHGSGTSLGDPIEVNSLISVLGAGRSSEQPCLLGSVKANIGHLEAAAGIAGLIKAALALQRAEIPPQLHLRKINPHLLLDDAPFFIPTELRPWPASTRRKLAGVSSFGFGGTNAHVILEEAPLVSAAEDDDKKAERPFHLLTISARSENALRELARRYTTFLREPRGAEFENVCFTANTGRSHLSHRLALVCGSDAECLEKLAAYADGRVPPELHLGQLHHGQRPQLAFLFTGDETPHDNWTRELYDTQPVFRLALDQCDKLLCQIQDSSPVLAQHDTSRLLTSGGEPRLSRYAIDYALAQMWLSWGIKPDVLIGDGVGVCVAGCVAGVFTFEEGLRLVLEGRREADHVRFKPARLPIISALTGRALSAEEVADPIYWQRRGEGQSPDERPSLAFAEYGCELCLSFGTPPSDVKTGREVSASKTIKQLPAHGDWRALLSTLAQLYVEGIKVDWDGFDEPYKRRRLSLPTYPFERKRYWLDVPQGASNGEDMAQAGRMGEMVEKHSTEAPQSTGNHREESPAQRASQAPSTETTRETRQHDIRLKLSGIVANLLGMQPAEIDPYAPFLEMGADSIVLVTAIRAIENSFGVKISIRQLFEDLTSIDALAAHLSQHAPVAASEIKMAPPASPEPEFVVHVPEAAPQVVSQMKSPVKDSGTNGHSAPDSHPASDSDMERIIKMQLDAFTRLTSQQLESLRQNGGNASSIPVQSNGSARAEGSHLPASPPHVPLSVDASQVERERTAATARVESKAERAESATLSPAPYVPYRRITPGTNGGLSARQAQHLEALIARFTKRTQKSKQLAQQARPRLADSRASVGFRLSVKEMLYPITGASSAGSKIWDIDGNEYIDITMGFGVHLFGHRAPFIQQALEEQLQAGIQLGPRPECVREVAELVCQLTGHERAAFCNSGTEAVMTALRLARASTGRSQIAIFSGSYHGHSDGTLAIAETIGGRLTSTPMAPGVPAKVAEDVVVLDYGSPQSLDYLRAHAHELAGVLVEPVQSRNPGLQPREFLHELRNITKTAGAALIFDEMVTGFRIHPDGAQGVFGVKADLATYGKIVGGGMPIGIVAGESAYMDGIDGGIWDYGDASYPRADTTFFGGTFCQHPLAMAAARAVLRHLRERGPALQEELNARTSRFAATLNAHFEGEEVPVRVQHFGSLFRFVHSINMDLFYYHLLEKGVYIWEWRSCFLSTAHTEENLAHVVRAVIESIAEMREGGFLPPKPGGPPDGARGPSHSAGNAAQDSREDGAKFEGNGTACSVPQHDGDPNGQSPSALFTHDNAANNEALGFWQRSRTKSALVNPVAAEVVSRDGADEDGALSRPVKTVDFSLYYFGKYEAEFDEHKYNLLLEGARFADRHNFKALWIPERHFHPFGGFSPNPSVLAAALARETQRIGLRAGSVVLPLHHPVRVAEEWAVVDNLSKGRVGISFASGWHPDDFVFAPEAYGRHRELMFEKIEEVKRLWRGETLGVRGGAGNELEVRLFPQPMQRELPVWVTVVNNTETYRRAGAMGAGVLTNLMGQTVEDLTRNVEQYRRALAEHGHDPARGHVSVLLHTYVGSDAETARAHARRPFGEYLSSSLDLLHNLFKSRGLNIDLERLSKDDLDYILDTAYERYVSTSALIGSVDTCEAVVDALARIGVDEVACFIDFGIGTNAALDGLSHLNALRARFQPQPTDASTRRRETVASMPLTEAQKQLWLLSEMGEEASLAYHESVAVELTGLLHLEHLREAFRTVLKRHEALRTAIESEGERQRILPALDIEVPLVDFSTGEISGRQTAVDAWLKDEAQRPFKLDRAPLLRIYVLRLEENKHRLVLIAHHIIIDSWSLGLIVQEVANIYSASVEGRTCALPAPMQFRDYLCELSEPAYLQRLQQAEGYWLDQFSGDTPSLALTSQRAPVKRYRGAKVSRRIDAASTERLKTYSRKQGCTLFMTLFAGYSALLHRLTGQEKVAIGIPATGRFIDGSESVVGYCTHLLPVLSHLAPSARFSEHLRSNRSTLLGAYEHEEYPFAKLIQLLKPGRDLSRTPIIQTTFNLEPNSTLPTFAGLGVALVSSPVYYTKFDLGVNVISIDGELHVDFDYDTDLFDAASVERLAEQFQLLLEGALDNAALPLVELPLMSDMERHKILVEWNATRAPLPREACVHELFEAQAQRTPAATAIVFHERQITYGELNVRANRLARYLRGLGLKPDERVAICVERSPEMMTGLLGILKAGCAYVPLDAEYPRARLAYMLSDSGASVLLTTHELSELFTPGAPRIVELDTLWPVIAEESDENPSPVAMADNLAYVIYTSGSTGRPKGVQVTQSAVVNLLSSMQKLPGLSAEDALLAVTTVCFDISVLELFLPLVVGARLFIADREEAKDGERLSQILAANNITAMQATPATWRLLLAAGWTGSPRLKVLCGGEALPRELAEELYARVGSLWNMYGPTETTIWSAVEKIEPDKGAVSIGRPITNTQMYVLDDRLQPLSPGMAGELYIAGDGLSRGYLNRADITAEKFIPHPFSVEPGLRFYRTGDLARYREDGKLELIGRVDHQVKLRGYRIELGEIEAALCEHTSVVEAVVVVHEDEPGNQRLIAYLVSRTGAHATANDVMADELSAFLSRTLPEYMIPSRFITLDALPRYPNGKINRGCLPAPVGARVQGAKSEVLPQTALEQTIADIWKEVLKVEKVNLYDNFFDLGGHSLLLTKVHRRLKETTGMSFSVMEMFRHPTIAALAGFLSNGNQASASPREKSGRVLERRRTTPAAEKEVAIIGMAGRFPGAASVEEFWRNLRDGVESVTFFTDEELEAEGVAPALLREPGFVKAGAVLDGVEEFDANFFNFSPREAEVTDPQHRLFLECAWEALENAGYDSERIEGAVGVYAAVGLNTYLLFNLAAQRDVVSASSASSAYQTFIGNDKDFVPSRVSYKLNLRGPSINVQTACSSSLVAVHMACRSLQDGECDMTLVGGVAVKVPSKGGYLHDEQGIDSPDGHCRAFDAQAAGTVFGSGVGIVVLKRLSDALRDGDHIHAVIKGSAVNNDGSLKVSYTAPSEDGQAEVVRMALEAADVKPETIGYVEAHGTGTHLGDPIEIAALTKAFAPTSTKNSCAIGSVKTNIGHLDTAAGIAGLIKTVLSLKHGLLPPSLHFKEPNPQIDFVSTPFYVNDRIRPWETTHTPRRAGVSSFGIGGTNAHVILEEAPSLSSSQETRQWQLLTLSAKTPSALDAMTANLAAHLKSRPKTCLADVAYTLQAGRRRFDHRRIVVCRDAQEAVAVIERGDAKRIVTRTDESKSRRVVFLFPGQGTQHVEMARGLYESEPSFRRTVDECAELLRPHLNLDLRSVLYPKETEREAAAQQLNQTALAQPALFVVQYALARTLMEWGVEPRAMLGHSIGEYAAACLAGLFSLEDALALIAARGRLMQSLRGGAMLAVPLSETEARTLLNEHLSLAAVNGVSQCIISGETFAVERLEAELNERGIRSARLQTSHAFHSVMMEPMLERFMSEAERVRFHSPRIPYLSSLTGDWVSPEEAVNPHYWVRQLRETVRCADGLSKLFENPEQLLLEIGPGHSLGAQMRRHPGRQPAQEVVSSMRHKEDPDSDAATLLTALSRLWLAGVAVDWTAFSAHERRLRVPLPAYPFERQRYWIDPPKSERTRGELHIATRKSDDLSRWFYLPCWKPSAPLSRSGREDSAAPQRLLVFTREDSFCRRLLRRLEERPDRFVVTVRCGAGFDRLSERDFVVNPGRAEDYRRLVEALHLSGTAPDKVLHLWNVSTDDEAHAEDASFESWQRVGFESLLNLAKALGDDEQEREIIVVSTGVHSLSGTEALRPERATLLAPCKTIPQEYRQLSCRSIDLILAEPESRQEKKLIEQLIAEFEIEALEPVVAYRNGSRLVQSFEPTEFAAPVGEVAMLREGGVYLITGGLGKIGLTLARYLSAATRGKLALVARAAFPRKEDWSEMLKTQHEDETTEKIRALVALEETGAEVFVYKADVTDEERMRAVVAQVEEEFGEISGVIHAAGLLPEQTFQLIRDSDEATLDWRNNPKLQGLAVLERVLAGREIDFCLLMSSLASVLGGIGYSTYCAANLFMDAFAHRQNRRGHTQWMSVNWDAWRFEEAAQPKEGFGASLVELSMTAEEGVQVFRRLLSAEPVTQVVISTADLAQRIDRWISLSSKRTKQEKKATGAALHPRPALAASYVAPETETEKAIADIWQQLFGIEQIGVHDDFFALGGDSLLSVQLTSRMRGSFKLNVGPRELFEQPTIAGLARIVEAGRTRGAHADELQPLRRTTRNGLLPLSFAQQRLWTVCQLGRGETAYNLPTATLFRGSLDVVALEKSLNEIVRRHEALRACFPTVDGQPLATIAPPFNLSLPVIDFSALPPERCLSRALKLAVEEVQRPFDLTTGPLLRACLARTGTEEHVLLLTMHHIVTDGWSMGVLIGELAALYEAFSRSEPSPLPELTIQYFDVAEWQRQTLQGEQFQSLLDYWKGQLGATPPKVELPTDRPRAAVQTFRAATLHVSLPRTLVERLKSLGHKEKATLFMTLLAAFKVLLRHYAGADKVVVGTDVANRQRSESEALIGFFVNQLVLLTDLSGNPTFRALLARVRETALGAFAHQELPFEFLVDVLKPERDASDSPLFQTKFVLQNAPQPPMQLSHLNISPLEVENPYAKFDLLLTLWESAGELKGTFEYKAELFEATTIEAMLLDYQTILHAVAKEPDISLSSLDEMLAEAGRRRSLDRAKQVKDAAQTRLKNARRKPLSAGTK